MSEYVRHRGEVLNIEGDYVQVKILQAGACAGCQARSMCSAAESKEKLIDAQMMGGEKVSVGDSVEVMVQEKLGWKAILLAYVLPFFVLIGTLGVLSVCWGNEVGSGLVALAAVGVYYLVLFGFRRKLNKEFDFWVVKE